MKKFYKSEGFIVLIVFYLAFLFVIAFAFKMEEKKECPKIESLFDVVTIPFWRLPCEIAKPRWQ